MRGWLIRFINVSLCLHDHVQSSYSKSSLWGPAFLPCAYLISIWHIMWPLIERMRGWRSQFVFISVHFLIKQCMPIQYSAVPFPRCTPTRTYKSLLYFLPPIFGKQQPSPIFHQKQPSLITWYKKKFGKGCSHRSSPPYQCHPGLLVPMAQGGRGCPVVVD